MVCHRLPPHPFIGLAQNIPDLGGPEAGRIRPLAPQTEHDVAATEGGLQEGRHEKADMKSAWSVQQQRLRHVIPRVIPDGISRGRPFPPIYRGDEPYWWRWRESKSGHQVNTLFHNAIFFAMVRQKLQSKRQRAENSIVEGEGGPHRHRRWRPR